MTTKQKKEYTFSKIKISSLVRSLLSEIDDQTIPLFKLWEDHALDTLIVTFNSIRILTPILESASKIQFNNNPEQLFGKLNIPEPKISWTMFRHGLSHGIRPFTVVSGGIRYGWGIKQYKGSHHISTDNLIIISARNLLDDLILYLKKFEFDNTEIDIQTGVKFVDLPN